MKKIFLLSALVVLLCAGCTAQKAEPPKKLGFGFPDKKYYPKLKDYSLSLELSPGSRRFQAGMPAELLFVLKNTGKKAVTLHEWYKFDPNNLQVKCQIWLPGTREPDPLMWLDISIRPKPPIWRYPLKLQPGEVHFVSTRLDFPANLVIKQGGERRYFIKGRLNLKSVDVSAPPTWITILPGAPKKTAENFPKKSGARQ